MRSSHELVLRMTVPGEPMPKQRARTISKDGRVWSYTPKRTVQAENVIRLEAAAKGLRRGQQDIGLRALTVYFYRGTGRTADLDNLVKTVTDALNGLAWQDDRQVVQLHAARFDRQPNPRTEISVHRLMGFALDEPWHPGVEPVSGKASQHKHYKGIS